jgi:hypothetical protein
VPRHEVPGGRRAIDLVALLLFGAAFGFVEAAVVYYLRTLIADRFGQTLTHYRVLLNLGFITFASPTHSLLLTTRLSDVEVIRESATIVMLACVAWVAGRTWRQRIGAFLVGFATWDLTYYLFLWIIVHWPTSLLTKDVFFLIPVAWIGPVITPLAISAVLLGLGIRLYWVPALTRRSALAVRD